MKKPRTTDWEIMGITVKNLPLQGHGENEGVHASVIKAAEFQVAHLILKNSYPLRGEDIKFLRKLLGLSLEKFAAQFDMTGSGVRKWEEEKKNIPLDVITQIALRSFFATKFHINLSSDFNLLRGREHRPKEPAIEYETVDSVLA